LTVAANFFNAAFDVVLVGCSTFGFVVVIFYSGSRVHLDADRKGYVVFGYFNDETGPTRLKNIVMLANGKFRVRNKKLSNKFERKTAFFTVYIRQSSNMNVIFY
jgi:HKD family nuclease